MDNSGEFRYKAQEISGVTYEKIKGVIATICGLHQ
jgi:hypothetical protein